jgi:hypothetical protein
VSLDIVGGRDSLPTTPRNYKYILSVVDHFTKWAEAIPLKDMKATTVAREFVKEWVCRHGVPYRILTDQGTNFQSRIFRAVCVQLGIDAARTTAFHPAANGACERFNGTMKRLLLRLVGDDPQNWDLKLQEAMLAYRSCVHSATGYTPYFLLHGMEVRLPSDAVWGVAPHLKNVHSFALGLVQSISDAMYRARATLHSVQKRSKERYDLGAVVKKYKVGDRIKLRKLVPTRGGV